jgi:sulfite oxidase
MVVLECAGNRRNEMAAIKLVTGRAPWNHGAIGNAEWEGVLLRDVLAKAGLNVEDPDPKAKHVVIEGLDYHHTTQKRFEISIPIRKAVDKLGHTLLAWKMNGEELLPDHGYPLRVIVPGYVGTRSVKWLSRITVSESESQSAWQQKDYKILPPKYHSLEDADFSVVPPIMAMNTQSAILIPEPGSTVPQGTEALWVKGYAWCGAGLPIIRVDVSVDRGITWEMADIIEQQEEATDLTWAWCKWQIPIKVPPSVLAHGGKWSICCKAFNRNCDTQPSTVESIWNFRGLATNAWHYVDLHVEAPTTTHKS